ncbi:MAG: zinc ribbon domain-containing protein [Slackia isoflavoniconvertens]|nr:zinc ribbon domain-containing protein [Slackia isoflavoniconvertens]
MFCVYCGTKLPDEARFCFMCGKKVEPADNAENIVAANSESIDEEGFGIEIQEAPTTSSSEKNPDAPELAIENDPIEDAHDAFATANESGPDETSAEDQSSEQAHGISESADENDHDEAEGVQGSNSAEPDASNSSSNETTVIPFATSSSKTTVIPLAAPSDKTTILPGFGSEKAALEQEKSDEIAALAALYPDANPAQFCDPTPFEAKSPDITELIAPAPINGTKPASAESVHYAEGQKRRALANAPFLSPSLQSSQCLQRPPHSACHSTFYLINARTSHVY